MSLDIFISYSSQDTDAATQVVNYLENEGYHCFVSYRDIPVGTVWASAITEALEQCKMMVALYSESYNQSQQVDREIELCCDIEHKPIITFKLSEAPMRGAKKFFLKNLNWISTNGELASHLPILLQTIRQHIGMPELPKDNINKSREEQIYSEALTSIQLLKDVFISYSRKDMDIADIICAAFDKANISYFIDRQDIGIGHPFAEIAKAIKECTLFLYLGSRNAYVSKYAPKEINYAVLHKPQNNILPYLIDDTPMPDELEFLLCDYNWRTRREHPIEPVLINDLLDLLGRESGNKQTSSKSSQENERYVVCLVDGGHSKLQVVKTIKETFSLGLKEAKDIVDSASCDLPFELSLREVEDVTNRLKEAGAKVTVSALHDQQIVPDKFVIRLLNTGPNKLQIVKTLKENLNIGIKEAKDIADAAPCDIPQEFSLSTAASITQLLRYYGAVCAIKSLRVSKANEGKYYIELLDDAKQYVSGLEVISNRISFSRDSLIDYQMYTPCILPILLDANNAVSLERAAKQNGAAMRLIQRTPKNTEIKFKLLAPGVNKLQVAQYLRENLKIDLAKAKEYVDKAPIIVGSAKDFETTKWFADGLRELGAMVSLQF